MADLEERVDKLEEKVNKMELELNNSLKDIQADIKEIKTCLVGSNDSGELKNMLIEKDVQLNAERIDRVSNRVKKIEDNQSKIVWIIITEVLGLVGLVIKTYLQTKQ